MESEYVTGCSESHEVLPAPVDSELRLSTNSYPE